MPEEYVPYVFEHERWEAWIGTKTGFNLERRASRELLTMLEQKYAQGGSEVSISADTLRDIRSHYLDEYILDFKHEFAIWKEYQRANADQNLDSYHDFMMQLRAEDLNNFKDVAERTKNDMEIRASIYGKIKEGGSHSFLRPKTV